MEHNVASWGDPGLRACGFACVRRRYNIKFAINIYRNVNFAKYVFCDRAVGFLHLPEVSRFIIIWMFTTASLNRATIQKKHVFDHVSSNVMCFSLDLSITENLTHANLHALRPWSPREPTLCLTT